MRSLDPPRSGTADRKPAARPRQPVAAPRPARAPRPFADGAAARREAGAAPSLPAADGLPTGLQMAMEAMSGFSLADVVVHRNSAEPARLGAAAFAQGNQIHLAPGQEQHLPHEAWHVVQQKQGRVRPTLQMKEGAINDDAELESEADSMGFKALTAPAVPPAALKAVKPPAGPATPIQGQFIDLSPDAAHNIESAIAKQDKKLAKRFRRISDSGTRLHLEKWVDGNVEDGALCEEVKAIAKDSRKTARRVTNAARIALRQSESRQKRIESLRNKSTSEMAKALFKPGRPLDIKDESVVTAVKSIFDIWMEKAPEIELPLTRATEQELAALLMQVNAQERQIKLALYFLGLSNTDPRTIFGIGTLKVARAGNLVNVTGRPGLFGIALGNITQARRHIVAWHTLRNLINGIVNKLDGNSVRELARTLHPRVPKHIAEAAEKIVANSGEQDIDNRCVIWLAIVLNNAPTNLWLGSASENISINTMAACLKKWGAELNNKQLTLDAFVAKIGSLKVKSAKARLEKNKLAEECRKFLSLPHTPDKRKLAMIRTRLDATLMDLEIDTRTGKPTELQTSIYELAENPSLIDKNKIGDILGTFLSTVPPPAASASNPP